VVFDSQTMSYSHRRKVGYGSDGQHRLLQQVENSDGTCLQEYSAVQYMYKMRLYILGHVI
jgi:hypothetical protein